MALKFYSSTSILNYNASPPADDGTKVSSNNVTWQFHVDKLGNPNKTLSETDITKLVDAFGSVSSWGDTVAELTAATTAESLSLLVATRGYFATNDAGGARYIFDSGSTAADDGGGVLQPDSAPTSGRWLLLHSDIIDARQFGAVGDGTTDNTTNFQNAVDYLDSEGGGTLYIPPGTFRSGNIDMTSLTGVILNGPGIIKAIDALADNLIDITTCTDIRLHDLTLDHNSASSTAGNAINVAGVTGLVIKGVTILNSEVAAIDLASGTNVGVRISDFTITTAVTGIDIGSGTDVQITNGTISTDVTNRITDAGTRTRIENVLGARTENIVVSGTFVLSAGVKTIAVAHSLDFTPSADEVILTMQQDTAVSDFDVDFTRVVSTTSTNVNAEVKIGTGSATTTATAKLIASVKTKRG